MGELYEKVCSTPVLMEAWKKIKAKGAAGGIDGVSVKEFENDLDHNIDRIQKELSDSKYVPEPLDRIEVKKYDNSGEIRPLSLPVVKDKLMQQAVKLVIEPMFEPLFLDCSYAYRPGKGTQKVFKRINHCLIHEHRQWTAQADFDRFFEMINHDELVDKVNRVINDIEIISLIRMWIKIGFVNRRGDYFDINSGVGQGSVISPLLSNIYVNSLDEYMTKQGYAYVRYSDNMLILGKTHDEARSGLRDLEAFVRDVLNLKLNENPRPIQPLERGFVFLGIYYRDTLRQISNGKIGKLRYKIESILNSHFNPEKLVEKINESLKGVRSHYGIIDPQAQFIEIDDFLCDKLVPVFSGYLQNEYYRNVTDLTNYVSSINFLSAYYSNESNKKYKELASRALKSYMRKKEEIDTSDKALKEEMDSADRALSRKKQKYIRKQSTLSEVIVNTPGTFIGKKANRLVAKSGNKTIFTHRLEKLRCVTITSRGVSLSSDIIKECSNRKIPVHCLDPRGNHYAMLYSPQYTQPEAGLAQLSAINNVTGINIARRIVTGKIRNQLNLVKFYGRSRRDDEDYQGLLTGMGKEIKGLIEEADTLAFTDNYNTLREKLFSVEGRAASTYWGIIKKLVSNEIDFPGRKRRGAEDLFNSMLNYGYGMLYSRLLTYVISAGLNPCLSFLHSPQNNRPSLIFDLIEEFRSQVVDRAVVTMVNRKEKATLNKGTGLLAEDTKKRLIENVLERLSSMVQYRGKKVILDDVMESQAKRLALCLEKGGNYRPYIGRY